MSEDTDREHIVRATVESIAYQTRDVKVALEADAGTELGQFRIDGGVATSNFFSQLLSDLVQSDLVRPAVDDTTALGGAYAAGLAVGYYESLDDLRDNWSVGREFEPSIDPADASERYECWTEALSRTRGW
jgi:glycerol kinase